MEKRDNVGYVLAITFLFIALLVVSYLGFFNNKGNEKNEIPKNDNTVVVDNNVECPKEEKIDVKDLQTTFLSVDSVGINFFYGIVDNGVFYYKKIKKSDADSVANFTIYNTELNKYSEVNNIKRLKTLNYGTSENPVSFLITEDGVVYSVWYTDGDSVTIKMDTKLKEYKVEDIKSLSEDDKIELVLKDGTTKIVDYK